MDFTSEYYSLDPTKPTIGLLMMVKNEERRLHVSLNSVVGSVDAIIIYDTGSTDKTLDIIKEFSKKHRINLYIKQGDFVDFSTSRNVCLTFAESVNVHYLLLLDCNDELQGGKNLKRFAQSFLDKENTGFLVCQQWWCGQLDKYYNVRFIRNRCGWRYRGSVHEWMKDTNSPSENSCFPIIRLTDDVVLYQDRTQDDDKTGKRFNRDRELLLKEYKADPKEPRTIFYLAQTCQCLGLHDEALYYSKLRLELAGFVEERFHSYMRCGTSAMALGHSWSDCMSWFLKAYEEFDRAEPLVKIADLYRHKATVEKNGSSTNLWKMAYMYIKQACQLSYPEHCILFVDKGAYTYYRWHLMSIIAMNVGELQEGKEACLKAIADGTNKEMNEKNLAVYLAKEKEIVNTITKSQFMNKTMADLKKQFPQVQEAQLVKRANAMWKKRK
jgi:glycosyltransferase involved in cell wall biosynthesis